MPKKKGELLSGGVTFAGCTSAESLSNFHFTHGLSIVPHTRTNIEMKSNVEMDCNT